MGKTYVHGSNSIDVDYASNRIMECVDGYKILSNNNIVESNYVNYLIDLALDEYFKDNFGELDSISMVFLNPSRRSHGKTFS